MKAKHVLLVIIGLALIVLGEFLKTSVYAEGSGFVIGMGLSTFAGGLYYIYKNQVEKRATKQASVSADVNIKQTGSE